MVFLVVKGTTYPDEFVVERKLSDAVAPPPQTNAAADGAAHAVSAAAASPASPSIVPSIAHLLNTRHRLKLVLMSAYDLSQLLRHGHSAASHCAVNASVAVEQYSSRIAELQARLKDAKTPVEDDEFDRALDDIRTQTAALFPSLCTSPDGTEAAVQKLYAQHDDPDLDEDTRLLVYHCRAIIDPEWKANEMVSESDAALWFCGKAMEATLAKYAGRNEKSKIIVKVAPRAGPAPSGEPRMRYEDQRALFSAVRERRETYKQLEESELRDRVLQQSRGTVRLSLGSGGPAAAAAGPSLRTDGLRPIYAQKEERELSA